MKQEIIEKLKKYNQEHLLKYLPILSQKEIEELEEQIKNIDFENLNELINSTKQVKEIEEKKIEHVPYVDKEMLSIERKEKLEKIGREVITSGHYAVITMAGGQGSRLGFNGPKGAFTLDTKYGKKYIFEIIIDTFKRAQKEYNVSIPWYVMTSKENHKETVDFLEKHNYFDYDKTKVKFFTQGELPLVTVDGKVILDKDRKIKEAANGNGGLYDAVITSGLLNEMEKEQIDWIFISNVDNILSNFVDPLLLGLTIEENTKIGAKSVAKAGPNEKIGVFCKVNGKTQVIEYIDLPKEMAEEVDEKGELVFGNGNFGNYVFNISVFKDLKNAKLPFHAAFKKSAFLDENNNYIEPNEPNVYKFEAFIFDSFERYSNISILRVKREEEFAPVKNATGVDSPETAIKLYNAVR